MVASLSSSGVQLGFGGANISLKVLYATGSNQSTDNATGSLMFDRIYTASVGAPYQVNPFEVEDGDAPDPALWPPSPISYSLSPWDGYTSWDSGDRAKSTNFDMTAFDYDSADFEWTLPTGYARNVTSLQQYLFVDDCTPATDCNASSSADCCGVNLGDISSTTVMGLSPNTDYTATIITLWEERGTSTNRRQSNTASTKGTLTEGTQNSFDQIYFTTNACPNCNQIGTNILLTNTDPAAGCTAGSDIVYANSTATSIGTLSNGDCLFTVKSGSPCALCSSAVTFDYAEDGNDYVDLNASGCVIAGPTTCGL